MLNWWFITRPVGFERLAFRVSEVGPEVYVSFVPNFHGIIEVPGYRISYSSLIGILAVAVSCYSYMTRLTLKNLEADCASYWVAKLLRQVVEYLERLIYASFLTTLSVCPHVCLCAVKSYVDW